MLVVKMGYEHIESGINCQDYAIEYPKIKVIVDGCSSCKNSEVGAKLFCHLLPKVNFNVQKVFNLFRALYTSDQEIYDNLLFTTNMVEEFNDYYIVSNIGDGYIIKERLDKVIERKTP